MCTDKITTAIGCLVAAGTAAEPVMNGVNGALHGKDYLTLGIAVLTAVWGFFTNKKGKPQAVEG